MQKAYISSDANFLVLETPEGYIEKFKSGLVRVSYTSDYLRVLFTDANTGKHIMMCVITELGSSESSDTLFYSTDEDLETALSDFFLDATGDSGNVLELELTSMGTDEFTVPVFNPVNAVIVFDDGTVVIDNDGAYLYTYSATGDYTISVVYGTIGNISTYRTSTAAAYYIASYITKAVINGDWGFTDCEYMFYDCEVLTSVDLSNAVLRGTMDYAFYGCSLLTELKSKSIDTSNVTSMYRMFYGATSFNQYIGHWDTSNVISMSLAFSSMGTDMLFNQNLNNWNVSNVTDMSYMLRYCVDYNQPMNNWDVSNVTNMTYMFGSCQAFNQDISVWDVSNVTNMSYMFTSCYVFNQDVSAWNVGNVTNMTFMFSRCYVFNHDISSWDVSNVTDMSYMFYYCSSFDQDLSAWNVGSVTNMSYMFSRCYVFNQDISVWDISNVTNFSYFLTNGALSTANYSNILKSWAYKFNASVTEIDFGNSTYDSSDADVVTARNYITVTLGITITDGGAA